MKTKELTKKQTKNIFESIKKIDEDNNEYWLGRELMPHLEYARWESFRKLIRRAILSLQKTYPHVEDHFREVTKKINVGSGTVKEAVREVDDYELSRHACYLIAQNGDSRKNAVALAQNYFAQQTRKQELREIKEKDIERILARRKLTESEKKFAGVMSQRGIEGRGIAEIKSAGDAALFGNSTSTVKKRLGVKEYKALADHLPTISIKAKDLATEMTTFKAKEKNLHGKSVIKSEHVFNNSAVRNMLTESGIYPERLPAEEDVKKLEKKYSEDEIKDLEDNRFLAREVLEIDIRGVNDENEILRIKNIIKKHKGDSQVRIYYGSEEEVKVVVMEIEISPEVVSALRQYMVITDDLFN